MAGVAVLYSLTYTVLLYAAVAWGIAAMLRRGTVRGADVLLWSVALYFLTISAGPEGYARFRVPVVPILALYAGRGWDEFRSTRTVRPAELEEG